MPSGVCTGLPPGTTQLSWEGPLLAPAGKIGRERPSPATHVGRSKRAQSSLTLALRESDGGGGAEPWPPGTPWVRIVRGSEKDIQAIHPVLCTPQTTCFSL